MGKMALGLILAVALGFGIRYMYLKPKFSEGESVPEVEHILMDGSSFYLSSLKDNYVLLHFWGSWCGPCREENPYIVDIYQKFGQSKFADAKGFEIVSMGVETSDKMWKRAIERDQLTWPLHIGQFDRFDSSMAKAFGVREIPTLYLLGPSQKVLMVNPTHDELEAFLTGKVRT